MYIECIFKKGDRDKRFIPLGITPFIRLVALLLGSLIHVLVFQCRNFHPQKTSKLEKILSHSFCLEIQLTAALFSFEDEARHEKIYVALC